jgi:hypothetical protein
MGYSMKDMENAARNLQLRLDANAEAKGKKLADDLVAATWRGRGLWVFLLWPVFAIITVFIGAYCTTILENAGTPSPFHWLGMLGGLMAASAWYRMEFTIRHPLLSAVAFPFVFAFLLKFLDSFVT